MAEALLQAVDLSYGYVRGRPLFSSLSVDLTPGRMTAITGPSGTGKSTLLYLLAGLLTPWSGSVVFHGRSQTELSDLERSRERAEHFGFVFQDFALDPRRTILDAVLEPCLYTTRSKQLLVDRALRLLGRMGVELQAGSRPGEISGGQAQRVGVCRALLLEPHVIFADEPTGNLDHGSADVVLSALEEAAADGCTVLIATHDDRVVDRCSERIMLR
jgi:ABC-type lipoprotein export system ATPase subunit